MSEKFERARAFVADAAQQSAQRVRTAIKEEAHQKGFTSAAKISLREIDNRLDAYKARMSGGGPSLSKNEQEMYAALDALRADLVDRFDGYWRETGIEWRPRPPLVRGAVVRPRTED